MKKFIAIIAAIAMIATMSVCAFAYVEGDTVLCPDDDTVANPEHEAGLNTPTDNNVHDVFVNLTGTVTHVICVDVAWGDMIFEYNGNLTWNPHDHEYVATEGAVGTWEAANDGGDEIDFVNHSDVKVKVSGVFSTKDEATTETNSGITATMDAVTMNEVTVNDDYTVTTTTGTMTVVPAGVPTIIAEEDGVIVGSVTLSVAEAA